MSEPSPSASHPGVPVPRPPGAPRTIHVLAKPAGPNCNLACAYCYYLPKGDLYPGDRLRMPDDVLERYIRQMIETQSGSHVEIAWQGGEPTLVGIDFYRRAVELVERYRRPGMTVQLSLQTNGTRLDDEWCAFLGAHGFLVGLSIDGPAWLHNAYRVDRGGAPTHARVLRAARLLSRHRVAFNVLSCVHAANSGHPLDVYRHLRDDVGANFIQFIPVVEPVLVDDVSVGVTDRTVDPDDWGRFLMAVFDEWARGDIGEVFVQQFDAALGSWLGLPSALCVFAETCGTAVALEHNGDVYACDHFVDPSHRLGNIRERHLLELVGSERQRLFGAAKRDALPGVCRVCPVEFACRGECPRNRFAEAADGEPGLNYLCRGYRQFFEHVRGPMDRMSAALLQGRSAAHLDGPRR